MATKFRLKEILQEKGWTARKLAELSGVNERTVRDISNNNYTRVGLDVLHKLSQALNCEPGDLIVKE